MAVKSTRSISICDVLVVSRALVVVAPSVQEKLLRAIIELAQSADRFRQKFGKVPGTLGNGTLEAAARNFPLGPVDLSNPAFCKAMALVLTKISCKEDEV